MSKNKTNLILIDGNEQSILEIKSLLNECQKINYNLAIVDDFTLCEKYISKNPIDLIIYSLKTPNSTIIKQFKLFYQKLFEIPLIVILEHEDQRIEVKLLNAGVQEIIIHKELVPFVLEHVVLFSIRRKNKEKDIFREKKIEIIGALAAGIAHDFNNILTPILGNISLVKSELDPIKNYNIYEILVTAEEASFRAQELANNLITYSKGGAPVKSVTNLFELIHDQVGFALKGLNIRCNLDVEPDMWYVNVDKGQINQVLNYLIINAYTSMPRGGEITISVQNKEILLDSKKISKDKIFKGKYLEISIQDQGIGISPQELKKIFDPYFNKNCYTSGLGLTTSYSIIRRHKGFMWAESTLNKGSIFTILLPAVDSPRVKHRQPSSDISSDIEKKKRIIIMDDEEGVRKILIKMLKRLEYEVIETKDGNELIEQYEHSVKTDNPADVMIIDLTIPGGMGGEQAISLLINKFPKIKAIVSSGYSNDPVMANHQKYGFIGILKKPFTIKALKKVLIDIFEH